MTAPLSPAQVERLNELYIKTHKDDPIVTPQYFRVSLSDAWPRIYRALTAAPTVAPGEGQDDLPFSVSDQEVTRIRNTTVGKDYVQIWSRMLVGIIDNYRALQRDLDAARRERAALPNLLAEHGAHDEAVYTSIREQRDTLRARLASAEEALVHVAHGMHKQPQYMLMRGLRLIDGNRVIFTLPNGSVIDAALAADKPQEGAQ